MNLVQMKDKLEKFLTPKRFVHSMNVMSTASELASKYGEDRKRAEIAGLLHDCARDVRGEEIFELCKKFGMQLDDICLKQPELLHAPLGAVIAKKEYGVEDKTILEAIACHTTGREKMNLLDKIIFISDFVEPARSFPGVGDIRWTVHRDLNKAVLLGMESTIKHVMDKGALIHFDTIKARNYLALEIGKR